jgi:hypothetical protein
MLYLVLFVFMLLTLNGCFADMRTPMIALSANHNGEVQSRVGTSSCYQYVWVIGLGDCSLTTAMRNGGITRVHHVDTALKTILFGAYSEMTMIVYGE